MAGGREHVQMEAFSLGVGFTLDRLIQVIKHLYRNLIRIIIVIAKERCTVENKLAHRLMTDKVIFHSFQQGIHRKVFLLKYMLT